MRELSLFSGAGGGLLGTYLLGWRPVGYVEQNDYCQRVIAARISDGILPDAPIFGDIRAFIHDGYAASYQGMVDVITAGFPCQPFSVAGKRKGGLDKRNLWPATIQCIRLVRPQYALLENVPGLLVHRYFGTILRTLAESGYSASWRLLSAAECGAPHLRKRLWIVAYSQEQHWSIDGREAPELRWRHQVVANRESVGSLRDQDKPAEPRQVRNRNDTDAKCQDVPDPEHNQMEDNQQYYDENSNVARTDWWKAEPGLGRLVDGMANRVERIGALGNGQVPAVVRAAWSLLYPIDRTD